MAEQNEDTKVYKSTWWEEDELYGSDFDPDDFEGQFGGKTRSKPSSESNSMRSLDNWSRPLTPVRSNKELDIAEVCENEENNNSDSSSSSLRAFDFSALQTEEDQKWYCGEFDEGEVMDTYHKLCEYMYNLVVEDPKEAAKQDVK
jgi:hypothetical protein